jgi:hypothetical protein
MNLEVMEAANLRNRRHLAGSAGHEGRHLKRRSRGGASQRGLSGV